LRALFDRRWAVGDLVAFHTAHKLTLMAHSPKAYAALGRLVAQARTRSRSTLAADYEAGFMGALSSMASPGRHANDVGRHGNVPAATSPAVRSEIADCLRQF